MELSTGEIFIRHRRQAWHAYYDIFVRHAFGSLRDVMQEVAYSPMMAGYLTFLQNKAIAYDGSYPDENFGARTSHSLPPSLPTTHRPTHPPSVQRVS